MLLNGCYVAIVTPFTKDFAVDEKGLRENIQYLLSEGTEGIVVCGSTGESASLTSSERAAVIKIAREEVASKVPVIVGIGTADTAKTVEEALNAQTMGADALLCLTPYYNKPMQEGLFLHFKSIAEQVSIPIILYNIPGRTAVSLHIDTIVRLCEFPKIIAIKDASGDIINISRIHQRCGDRLVILSGDDTLVLPVMSVGGKGIISVVANIFPKKIDSLVKAYQAGQTHSALAIYEQLMPLLEVLFIETNPIGIKAAMNHLGLHAGPLRQPLTEMHVGNKEKMISVLKNVQRVA